MTGSVKLAKFSEAIGLLNRCLGKKGVWADPTRYQEQCWTRDFGLAIAPLLLQLGEDRIVREHLINLSERQRPNGQIPILFLDDEAKFVAEKEAKSKAQGRESFMLGRYRKGELWNLTPGTRDSEIIYLIAMHEYAEATGDRSLLKTYRDRIDDALAYVESELIRGGLVIGCDWRDTMEKQLGDLPLLTNNSLLYRAYRLMGLEGEARELRMRIHVAFLRDMRFIDYPGNDRFDPLGGALAVLCGVVRPAEYPLIVNGLLQTDTALGVSIKCRHNPLDAEEREVIERTDGEVVWPFVAGFMVLALCKMHAEHRALAEDQFRKMVAHAGFREWYDPATGKGYGAGEQLWSAALYTRAYLQLLES